MSTIDQHSIFTPGQHIENPKGFAGRKFDLERALKSLCSPGNSIIVFGERGVGKSSFTEMIKLIAMGDTHLLFRYNLHKLFPPDKFKYKLVCVECDAEADSTAKVLQRLITSPNGIKQIVSSRIEKIESSTKDKYAVDLLKILSIGTESGSTITSTEFKEESIFETFTNLIQSISKNLLHPNEGLLIVIDEFDLVTDSAKMASLIKTLSKNNVKFLISGIAESYDQLISGHQSISRQLMYGRIHVKPMSRNEILELFELITDNSKQMLKFDNAFIEEVIAKSNGYPYYVQLFGQLALDNYVETKGLNTPILINRQNLEKGIKKLALFDYQMEEDYIEIIKSNPLKELVLKLMAKTITKKISHEDIYAECHKLGLMPPFPKNIIASLLGQRDPQFLIRETESSVFLTFANPLFKVFSNMRAAELIKSNNGQFVLPREKYEI